MVRQKPPPSFGENTMSNSYNSVSSIFFPKYPLTGKKMITTIALTIQILTWTLRDIERETGFHHTTWESGCFWNSYRLQIRKQQDRSHSVRIELTSCFKYGLSRDATIVVQTTCRMVRTRVFGEQLKRSGLKVLFLPAMRHSRFSFLPRRWSGLKAAGKLLTGKWTTI